MNIWETAGLVIDATFADPEPLVYTGGGLTAAPLKAIRLETPAPDFEGKGRTLRTIEFEVAQNLFASTPRVGDTAAHRGRAWSVQNIDRIEDVQPFKFRLTVTDAGAA